DYSESQLIEIKVALDMPYQNSTGSFERHYGEIEISGKIYTYVKRKIEDGYLILKCIPNKEKEDIKNADNILFNANNGLDQEHNGKNNSPVASVFKNIFSEFDNYFLGYNFRILSDLNKRLSQTDASCLHSISLPVAEKPPETPESSLC